MIVSVARLRCLFFGAILLSFASASGASAPPFLLNWGSQGAAPGQFDTPSGIAVNALGQVYVADRNNDRIQKFSASGVFISLWGGSGTGPGQFASPRDVAIDASGNVYVADTNNDRVQKFSGSGTFITQWGTTGSADGQFRAPRGIVVDQNGFVYVVEDGFPSKRVQKFTSTGGFVTKWGSAGTGDGQFQSPRGIAIDENGFVYVSDAHLNRVQKFTSAGVFVALWGTPGNGEGEFNFPIGVRWWRTHLYVVDQQNHRVQALAADGTFQFEFGTRCRLSDNLGCVDPDAGGSLQLGDGQFNFPQGLAVHEDGSLYVTDTENNRILKFGAPATDAVHSGVAGAGCWLASPNPTLDGRARVGLRMPERAGRAETYEVGVQIFDVSGRLVRRLEVGRLSAGDHFLDWDGRTATGLAAPPGVYLLQVSIAGLPDRRLKLVRFR